MKDRSFKLFATFGYISEEVHNEINKNVFTSNPRIEVKTFFTFITQNNF